MSDPTGGSYGVDPTVLEKDGHNLACLAVEYDTKGQINNAIFYYGEAGQALLSAALAGSQMPNIVEKANEYILRAEALKNSGQKSSMSTPSQKSQQQVDMDRAVFLLNQGFEEDENENKDEAAELYSQAVEMFLKIRQETTDPAVKEKVTKLATNALDRAEFLKKGNKVKPKVSIPTLPSNRAVSKGTSKVMPILGFGAFLDDEEKTNLPPAVSSPSFSNTVATRGIQSTGSGEFSKEEIDVLRRTSEINGRKYVPFMAIDVKERFAFPVAFTDKDGKLALSPKQRSKFTKWVRPEEFAENPQMIMAVSSMSIRQTIVSDCSFVASLAISAQYERRFKKKLITSIIYPQNRRGEPVYNPCGKYMVKLHINGVHRKVVIDDFLPMGQYGELLCSYSNNHSELWVSLLEKAYMKVMGGYDFPGSNSNIDLHALTGWIPERVAVRPGTEEFDKEREFKRLLDRFHRGHCLVTVATGEMSEAEGDRAGLVPTHAYALLDIREVMGKRLLMLKNPWNHLRWKGRFSERDLDSWTPSLQRALNYDPKSAQSFDNGVFWIDYDSLCRFYDVIYINWNPELFSHTSCWHHTWHAKEGPKKDSYNMSDNPQYRLEVKAGAPSAVWILLTRHIVDKDDFADNKEFITVLVYKTDGKKVFYPYDPPPYKDGVRINSPHYLCKMVEDRGTNRYTLVISQYAKNNTIHYTLRVFATCEFSLTEIKDPFNEKYSKRLTGQWKGNTAGGCANYPQSYNNNPMYQFKIDNAKTDNHVLIELLGPKQYSVGFNVVCVTENVSNSPTAFKKKTSGDFRPGYCVLQIDNIPGGVYNVIPCTFQPGKEGPFFLDFSCSGPITLSQLQ